MQKIKIKKKKTKKEKNARLGRRCSESQPAGTKNVVSIFIEVLYSSEVENIYYLNYIPSVLSSSLARVGFSKARN